MTIETYAPSAPSRWVDLDGPVHYVDHGGPAGAPLIVCVHGLGGSHANWTALAPLLTSRYRVLAVDLAGFGLTAGSGRSATVMANRRLLDRFLGEVGDGPVVLMGNSMGGLITALEAAKHPEKVSATVLINPVLPLGLTRPDPLTLATFAAFAVPAPIRRALSRRRPPPSPEALAFRLLQLCCGDPARIPPEVLEQHFALARRRMSIPDTEADLLTAARSLARTLGRPRQYVALLRGLRTPVLLLHGERDRLVPVRAARIAAAANPGWRYEEATGVGHVPMLEVPVWTADHVLGWLSSLEPAR